MDISSLTSSLQNIQSLQNLYSTQAKPVAATQNSDFSQALKTSKASTPTSSDQSTDSLSMLKDLIANSSFDRTDLLLQALNSDSDNSTNNVNSVDSLPGLNETSASTDPFIQALNESESNNSFASLEGLQGTDSNGSQLEDTLFNSNLALENALTKSGMPASRITQVLNAVNMNSQYNQNGTMSNSASPSSNLFSGMV